MPENNNQQMFFSPSKKGFYSVEIHGDAMPADAKPIEDELYRSLLGGAFEVDESGVPFVPMVSDDSVRSGVASSIEAWRDAEERAGIKFTFDGHQYDGGDKSRLRLQDAVASGVGDSGQFFWTDEANEDVPMQAEDLSGLYGAMMAARVEQGFKIHIRQRQMKEEIATLDREALMNYSVGWPTIDADE